MNLLDAIDTIDILFGARVRSVIGVEGTVIDCNKFAYQLYPSYEPRTIVEILWDDWGIGRHYGEILKSIELIDI